MVSAAALPVISLVNLSAICCLDHSDVTEDPRFRAVSRMRRLEKSYLIRLKTVLEVYYYSLYMKRAVVTAHIIESSSLHHVEKRYRTYELCAYALVYDTRNFWYVPKDIVDAAMVNLVRSLTPNVLDYYAYLPDDLKTIDMVREISSLPRLSISYLVIYTPPKFRTPRFFYDVCAHNLELNWYNYEKLIRSITARDDDIRWLTSVADLRARMIRAEFDDDDSEFIYQIW